MFTVDASTFKQEVERFRDLMSQQYNLKDIHLANYNLFLEVSELYETVEILIHNNINNPIPALCRLLFERYIYILFLNEKKQYTNDRAKRYLDYREYEIQKYHEFVYRDDTNEISFSNVRSFININKNDSEYSEAFNVHNLKSTESNYRANFTNIDHMNTDKLKWYFQTNEYKENSNGDKVPNKLYNFKDLCDYLGYPVYYYICYKNFSSNIHGSASLRSTIKHSINSQSNKNGNIVLSINIIAYSINRLYAMFE
ncbi:TPA: hypothetical protein P6O31_002459 [Staphylococcus aureus]|nr:hypothetical protein [Staphylococcus aureus]HDP4175979.1 hypothetical protein [Staphylococcus aureus]HDP4181214.1 hypothetical protein [Staphylococcus aureus]HDR2094550.1 hypothetical protein [Staphylococcus aureus]